MVGAHCPISKRPTSVEPVKVSFLTFSCAVKTAPISADLPVITLITPLGIPAISANLARAKAQYGVSLAGLITMVQPAASAGAALRVIMAIGKFHGVMAATTPIGSLITKKRCPALVLGMTSP